MLVSGPDAAKRTAAPVLEAIGARTVDVGLDLGTASALKLAVNSWISSLTVAAGQALELARALGLPPELVLETIAGSASDSPYLQAKGKAIVAGSREPQFALGGALKDLHLIRDAAAESGVRTTVLDAMLIAYQAASDAGHGGDDMAAVAVSFRPA